jgi:hypothetical protein
MSKVTWNIGEPGGPSGPFYSVITSQGTVVAMQITEQKYAQLLQWAGNAFEGDTDTVQEAAKRLRKIFERDAMNEYTDDIGLEVYLVGAVVEALFGKTGDPNS